MWTRWLLPLLPLTLTLVVRADGPADNQVDKVRPVPPPGVVVPDADRQALEDRRRRIGQSRSMLCETHSRRSRTCWPCCRMCRFMTRRSARRSPTTSSINLREVAVAKKLLEQGLERAGQLREGKAPWDAATGLVVRGYVSRIDGSVQPYGLVVPASYQPNAPHRFRLDVWCHGRGENLSELNFINGRQTSRGEFTPPNAFVVHPYGRYCNANKFAGEIDLFEAIDDIKKHYPIDEDRLVMRGFSMGGAACWQFAVHYPSMWVAAAPGPAFPRRPTS